MRPPRPASPEPTPGRGGPARVPALVLAAIAAVALAAGCDTGERARREAAEAARRDSIAMAARADSARRADSIAALPRFLRVPITGPPALWALRQEVGDAGWRSVLRLNRVDSAHVWRGDTLIVPRWLADSLAAGDPLAFSPFPRLVPALADTPRALLVSLRVQAVGAYERGRLARWAPTSTGRRETPTPAGFYRTNWKDLERTSTVNDEWLLRWYVNLHNFEGVSFHLYDLPGHPASHSCVRLLEEDARWLYGWVETWDVAPDGRTVLREGTPVAVFGAWDWGGRPPWLRLPEDAGATTLADAEIGEALRLLRERDAPVFPVLADSARAAGLTVAAPERTGAAPPGPASPDTAARTRAPARADSTR